MAQQDEDREAATPRLPVGMVEIGPAHAVRARDVCEVEHDHRSGESLIGLDFSGRQADATSRLSYAEIMRRLRQAQLDELAEPGDPEVVHLLREALDHLPEDRRQWLDHQVRQLLREARGAVTIPPNVTLTRDEVVGSSPGPADAPDWPAEG